PSRRSATKQRHELPPSHAGHGRSLPPGLPHQPATWAGGRSMGQALNCSESDSDNLRAGLPPDRLHDRHPDQGCSEGVQKMRSIARVKDGKSPKATGSTTSGTIEMFWGKPMPGTANGRGPGK